MDNRFSLAIKRFRYFIKFSYRHWFFKIWYRLISLLDKNSEVLFMNFGYTDINLNQPDGNKNESNRFSIQLYRQLVESVPIDGKDILEVGCGRGGGLAYLARHFTPTSAVGLDREKSAVRFCRRFHKEPGLTFQDGNAMNLPFPDQSFDVIINVESSHRYENMKLFLREVHRLLRPNGYLLLTDFRRSFQMPDINKEMETSGLSILRKDDITPNVAKALELDDERRRSLIRRVAPKFLQKLAMEFAGTMDSDVYRNFMSRKWIYFNFILVKQPVQQNQAWCETPNETR